MEQLWVGWENWGRIDGKPNGGNSMLSSAIRSCTNRKQFHIHCRAVFFGRKFLIVFMAAANFMLLWLFFYDLFLLNHNQLLCNVGYAWREGYGYYTYNPYDQYCT